MSLIKEGDWLPADSFFFTDTCPEGFGAVCKDKYMHGTWPDDICQLDLHISDLQLYTIVIAIKLWASQLTGLCVLIACDKEAATISINSGKSKDLFMQKCLRELWFYSSSPRF